jgi:hypothetical protein
MQAQPGETIQLDASGSYDPDGDAISYSWFHYREAGTLPADLEIRNNVQAIAEVDLTDPHRTGTLHIIFVVKDNGKPPLYGYRRVILEID